MVPEANVPMFSGVNVPAALSLVLAVRAERVASVDAGVQVEPMLSSTGVPAVQPCSVAEKMFNDWRIAYSVVPTQNLSA